VRVCLQHERRDLREAVSPTNCCGSWGLECRTFIPSEVPTFQRWFCYLEECRRIFLCSTSLCYSECEVRVGATSIGLAAIDRGVDFKANVKELSGEEVSSVSDISYRLSPRPCTVWKCHTDRVEGRILK